MNIVVKLTKTEVEQALKNYASQKLSGSKLNADTVKITHETEREYSAEVSFKESSYNSGYYDR